MEHSAKYYNIKRWYIEGYWTREMVMNVAERGIITHEECDEILGVNEE